MRRMPFFTVFATLIFLATSLMAEARNVALVIGNSEYTQAISRLDNPVNDARDVAAAFEQQGYEVIVALDLGQRALQSKLIDFRTKADAAEIAVVYYAGHGMEIGGQNYLVPVDARLSDVRSASLELINISTVLDQISGASKLRMLVLDACRDNPFLNTMKQLDGTRSAGRGLARVSNTSRDTVIAFAAAAGAVTPDGEPGGNSPFTQAFLTAMKDGAVDVRLLLGKVRDEMQSKVKGSSPALYASLGGDKIVINPITISKVPEPQANYEDLTSEFLAADAMNTRAGWNAFITVYEGFSDHPFYHLALRKRDLLVRQELEQAANAPVQTDLQWDLPSKTDTVENTVDLLKPVSRPAGTSVVATLAAPETYTDVDPAIDAIEEAPFQRSDPALAALIPLVKEKAPEQTLVETAKAKDRAIRDLQILLKDRNCYRGSIDGLVGPGTIGGVARLATLTDVKGVITRQSSGPEFRDILEKLQTGTSARCPKVVVKRKPTAKPKQPIKSVRKTTVATIPEPVVPKPRATSQNDFRDAQGNMCDWSNRGNVCE